MAMQNEILSIIHPIKKPNSWHEAFILYLASETETLKPQVGFIVWEYPDSYLANALRRPLISTTNTQILQNKGDFFLWKSSTHHKTQMMMFSHRYDNLFKRCLNFSLIYIFQVIFPCILYWDYTPGMESLHILSGLFFHTRYSEVYENDRQEIIYVWPFNSLNSSCK